MPLIPLLLLLSLFGSISCGTNMDYADNNRLRTPLMEFNEDRSETNLYQKTYYSREGSTGGIGAIAGGGCGCY